MTDLGEMKYFLGLEIEQTDNGVLIHQKKYPKEIIKKFNMEDCKEISALMETQLKLEQIKTSEEFDSTTYRSMIGSLIYLCASRPNLACTVNMMSCYNANPSKQHAVYVKRILRYVKYSLELGIWFESRSNSELMTFSDVSYANSEKCRSKSSYYCSFGSGIFCWSSKNQTIMAQSYAEAKYIVVNLIAKQAEWSKKILTDI
ncbi:uncharacterized mitochondrial protein AtMg00810-like [Rutidosis leptorrhynchoides]|uniref:uncharacterized mitochondrial protein AtMg00810-like n=1 Tax=Rutidosis leptorrhynchoides TaxID=125765 RepID=UPI003A99C998